MYYNLKFYSTFVFLLTLFACSTTKNATTNEEKMEFTILQINDVYEINPLEGGKYGGLARVSTLAKKYKQENPNFLCVISGDFLNPSAINNVKYEGKRLKGRHMVDVMNSFVDIATFGNHEFDIEEQELQERINESKFDWVSTNVWKVENDKRLPFYKKIGVDSIPFKQELIKYFASNTGKKYPVRFFGVTLDAQKRKFVSYDKENFAIRNLLDSSKVKNAINIGLTHVSISTDLALGKEIPEIQLQLGGHEHTNMLYKSGNSIITKADANAKTAYLHKITYYPSSNKTTILSQLIKVDETIPFEEGTEKIVQKWNSFVDSQFEKEGFKLREIVCNLKEDLDGRESITRSQPTKLSIDLAKSFKATSQNQAEIAILNTGSIRVDDIIKGSITQYDVLRIIPFGGELMECEVKGSLLKKLEEMSVKNQGTGGYLIFEGMEKVNNKLTVNNIEIDDNKFYKVITSDFLLTGREKNMDFFNLGNPDIINHKRANAQDKTDLRKDVRLAYIHYLKKNCN
ncbi:MAG: bifunctional metallophosphatase/5'-nucleotidase [Saprospiraceae bacterium]|nr:bifunctional metallophosphatase/5'-nucleotidase [Saprospiraceae bacterium]